MCIADEAAQQNFVFISILNSNLWLDKIKGMSFDKQQYVVEGEAAESDDDDAPEEIGQDVTAAKCRGIVIDGEAPESDDEVNAFSNISLSTANEAGDGSHQHSRTASVRSHNINLDNSILQRNLYKRNQSLWQNINIFLKSTVVTASSQIQASDQLLMKSQVTLQAASRAIVLANDTSESVLNKCRDILSYDFLPEINIPKRNCVQLEK